MRTNLLLLAGAVSLAPTISSAFGASEDGGWGHGDYGRGCCSVPEVLRSDVEDLRKQMLEKSRRDSLDFQLLGSLCEEFACGGLVESQASLILDRMIAAQEKLASEDEAWWNWLNGFVAALTSIGGLLVAAAGLALSVLSLRTATKAENQSEKNEAELNDLKALSVEIEDAK